MLHLLSETRKQLVSNANPEAVLSFAHSMWASEEKDVSASLTNKRCVESKSAQLACSEFMLYSTFQKSVSMMAEFHATDVFQHAHEIFHRYALFAAFRFFSDLEGSQDPIDACIVITSRLP